MWYEGRDTNEFDIALGVNLFETKEEARQFIDNYADNLLLEGYAAQSYGTALWENN
ncbi:hypothetical protein ACQUEF_05895 [Vagococcus fluvialis]|uniref:hypothetical protein n=1 Tax=Vagococcus fluvialis TaxID=2738 RepID=UPI003D0BD275